MNVACLGLVRAHILKPATLGSKDTSEDFVQKAPEPSHLSEWHCSIPCEFSRCGGPAPALWDEVEEHREPCSKPGLYLI